MIAPPVVTLDDVADRELLSDLSFADILSCKHVDVVCSVAGSEARIWRTSEITPEPDTETFRVRLREWPSIEPFAVGCNRLRKHTSFEPCV